MAENDPKVSRKLNLYLNRQRDAAVYKVSDKLTMVGDIDPDVMGEAVETAGPGESPLELAMDPEGLRQRAESRRRLEMLKKAPNLYKWLDLPDNAAISKDELENLNRYRESMFEADAERIESREDESAFSRGVRTGVLGLKASTQGAAVAWHTDTLATIDKTLGDAAALDAAIASGDQARIQEIIDNGSWRLKVYAQRAMHRPELAEEYRQDLLNEYLEDDVSRRAYWTAMLAYQEEASKIPGEEFTWANWDDWAVNQFGVALPYLGASLAAQAAGGRIPGMRQSTLALFGYQLGQGEITAAVGEAGLAIDFLDDKAFRERQDLAALAYGGTEAVLGPAARLARGALVTKVREELLMGAVESWVKRTGKTMATSSIEEGFNELFQEIAKDWAVTGEIDLSDEALDKYVETFAAGALVGGGVSTVIETPSNVAAARRAKNAQVAVNAARTLEELTTTAAETKMRTRSPRKYKQFLTSQGFDERSIYIDPEALENVSEAEREALGINAKQYTRASESGSPLAIQLSRYLQVVPGTDMEQTFIEHGTLRVDTPPRAAAQDYQVREAPERAEEAATERTQAATVEDTRQGIVAHVAAQLRAAGVRNVEGAELWGAVFSTLAQRTGLSVERLRELLPASVIGPATPKADRLAVEARAARVLAQELDNETEAFEVELPARNEVPELTDEQRQMLEAGELPRGIDSSAFLYQTDDSQRVPLDLIQPIRARPEGIANAKPLMARAALTGSRRVPLSVKANPDGTYTLLDGNSTYAVLSEAQAQDAEVRVFTDEEFEAEQVREGIRKILKDPGKKPRKLDMWRLPKDERKAAELLLRRTQPFASLEEMVEGQQATDDQAELNSVMRDVVEGELGGKYKDAPKKGIDRSREKVADSYDGDHRLMVDVVRAGAVATTPSDGALIIERLAARYTVLDNGLDVTDAGYFDQKLTIRMPSGRLAEIQIWPAGMLEAKDDGGGHDLYKKYRSPTADEGTREEARQQMLDLYFDVITGLDGSWAPYIAPQLAANADMASRAASTDAVNSSSVISEVLSLSKYADASTGQLSSPANNVAEPSGSTRMTPSSTAKNLLTSGSSLSTPNMGSDVSGVNVRTLNQSAIPSELVDGQTPDGDHVNPISTRYPTAVKREVDPLTERLRIDTDVMRETPDTFAHNMEIMAEYPQVSPDISADPDIAAEQIKAEIVDNLLWLHDRVPEEIRNQSKRWYDGARALTTKWAQKYGLPDFSIAGVLAGLSPQKDWYQNVSLAERVLDVVAYRADHQFDAAMEMSALTRVPHKPESDKNNVGIFSKPQYAALIDSLRGKTYNELTDIDQKAAFVRLYDETYNPRGFRTVDSEGQFIGDATGAVSWGSLVEIGKAITSIENAGDVAAVSGVMGGAHKIRNFFMNILAPNSPQGEVTIDTHAVAAAFLSPFSGSSVPVSHALGTGLPKKKQPPGYRAARNSAVSGAVGTYGLIADAYREAAAARGILAREMQSITWEAIRGLYPARWKRAKNVAAVEELWQQHHSGQTTLEETRDAIEAIAGGIENPSWYRPGGGTAEAVAASSYEGELSGGGLPRRGAGGLDGGVGRTAAAPAAAQSSDVRALQQQARGEIRIPVDGVLSGETVIELFSSQDQSTFLHESGHFFLEVLQAVAQMDGAPQQIIDDVRVVNEWLGRAPDDMSTYTTEQQEQWAEAFTTYLKEGRAPSPSLKVVFHQFAKWLIDVFKRGGILGIEPSPEVRGVMDRLLATDEEIEVAAAVHDVKPLYAEIPPNVTEEEWAPYVNAHERAAAERAGRMLKKMMKRIFLRRSREWKKRRDELISEVTQQLRETPVYRLVHALGNKEAGLSARIDKAAIIDLMGEQVLQDLTRARHRTKTNLYTTQGTAPQIIAENFNFPSVGAMIVELRAAKPFQEAVDAEVERRLEDELGDPDNEQDIREEAEAALKNGHQNEAVAREATMLEDDAKAAEAPEGSQRAAQGRSGAVRQKNRWQIANAAAKAEAEDRVDAMSVREIMGYRAFMRASQKAARDAQRALATVIRRADGTPARGSAEQLRMAAEAKRRELLNDHIYRIARERARSYEAARKRIRRTLSAVNKAKAKRKVYMPAEFVDAYVALLRQYSFATTTHVEVERRADIREFYQQLIDANRGSELGIPQSVLLELQTKHYTELTGAELDAVITALDNIAHMGRATNKMIAAEAQFDLDQIVDELSDLADQNLTEKPVERESGARSSVGRTARQWMLHVLNADTVLSDIDGKQEAGKLGAAYRYVKQGVDKALARIQHRRQQAAKDILKLYKDHLGKDLSKYRKTKVYENLQNDGQPVELSRFGLLSLALNSGNEQNWERLTNTEGKGTFDAAALKRLLREELTQKEWDFIQGVWDYIGSYWKEIAEQERKYTGVTPKKVRARIMIEGAPPGVRGGYFPIKYDTGLSPLMSDLERAKFATEGTIGTFAKAQTNDGFAQERAKSTGKPIDLSLAVIDDHVFNVIHALELRGAIRDAASIVYNERFAQKMLSKGRKEDVDALKYWLEDAAAGDRTVTYGAEKWLRWMRGGFTINAIGFKMSTALLQLTGITQSMVVVGYGAMVKGYGTYLSKGPLKWAEVVAEKSPLMAERRITMNRDINQITNELNTGIALRRGYDKFLQWMVPSAYYAMQMVQYYAVDLPTWIASYEKAIAAGTDPDTAATVADRDVRRAQGSGLLSDRGMLERGRIGSSTKHGELPRNFTVLGSYMFNKFNLAYTLARQTNYKNPAQVAKLAVDFFVIFSLEAFFAYLLREGWPDDDDDETIPQIFLQQGYHTALSTVPFLREASAAAQGFGGGGPVGSYNEALGDLVALPDTAMQIAFGTKELDDELNMNNVKAVTGFGGSLLWVPSRLFNDVMDAIFTREFRLERDWAENLAQALTGLPLGGDNE